MSTQMTKFGIDSSDLESAARTIGTVLSVELRLHDSSFRGGDYYRADTAKGTIFLQKNLDVLDNEPFEESWPKSQLILYLDGLDEQAQESHTKALRAAQELQVTQLL